MKKSKPTWSALVTYAAFLFVACILPANAHPAVRPEKMTVLIQGIGSSVRTIFAGNQDSYVGASIDKSGDKRIVKLIDWFPGYVEESPLKMNLGLTYRIIAVRTTWCDSTPPAISVVHPLVPSKAIVASTSEEASIPCYRIEHRDRKPLKGEPNSSIQSPTETAAQTAR